MSSKSTYQHRNEILQSLGFTDYSSYLKSALWAQIRERVLREKGRSCYLCYAPATQVHHLKYTKANLSGENIRKLVPICAHHHRAIEIRGDGTKRPFTETSRKYNHGRRKKVRESWAATLNQSEKSTLREAHELDAAFARAISGD